MRAEAARHIDRIEGLTRAVLDQAAAEGRTPVDVALTGARARIEAAAPA